VGLETNNLSHSKAVEDSSEESKNKVMSQFFTHKITKNETLSSFPQRKEKIEDWR